MKTVLIRPSISSRHRASRKHPERDSSTPKSRTKTRLVGASNEQLHRLRVFSTGAQHDQQLAYNDQTIGQNTIEAIVDRACAYRCTGFATPTNQNKLSLEHHNM